MTTFVLVHGAWHGGWCWRKVRNLLQASGDDVYTPTLTGLGERAHLASPEVGLGTHVEDVLGVLAAENLFQVVLVGHSYGGVVVTAVADRSADRIARLTYLDAVVPKDGQCFYDCIPPQLKSRFEDETKTTGDGWRVPVSIATAQFLGLTNAEDIRSTLPRLTPHPIRTFREAMHLKAHPRRLPCTYINCIGDKAYGQPRSTQATGIEDYHEVRTGHDAMITAPGEIAALLRESKGGARA